MLSAGTVVEAEHLGWFATAVVVFGVAGLALLGLVLMAVRKSRTYAALASEAESASIAQTELRAGPGIVVGIVENAQNSQEAVTVEVEQEGSERESSGSWSHRWTETSRRVRVAPFYLRRPNGERVRVEPTKEVFLVDDMDGHILVNHSRRVRYAKLVPGEEVIARGVLREDYDPESTSRAYRDLPKGWVMTAPSRGVPLFLSSEPLAARFHRLRRFHYRAAGLLLLLFVGMQIYNHADHSRLLFGSSDEATIERLYTYVTTDDDGDKTTHYGATSITSWGAHYSADLRPAVYGVLDEGMRIPIVHVNRRYVQYGARASMHLLHGLICLGSLIAAALIYYYRTRGRRAWYETKVKDSSSGRLNPHTGLVEEKGLLLRDHDTEA